MGCGERENQHGAGVAAATETGSKDSVGDAVGGPVVEEAGGRPCAAASDRESA